MMKLYKNINEKTLQKKKIATKRIKMKFNRKKPEDYEIKKKL